MRQICKLKISKNTKPKWDWKKMWPEWDKFVNLKYRKNYMAKWDKFSELKYIQTDCWKKMV